MEDQPTSNARDNERLVEEEPPENMHSRESPPRCCQTIISPHPAPSFTTYYDVVQAPGPSPAPDSYMFPVPLQQPSAYGGSRYVLMQTPVLPSDGRQYMTMVTSVPINAISVNENYRAGYHNVNPTRTFVSKDRVGDSATFRSPPSSSSQFEPPLATSTPKSSFSQVTSEQRRPSPTKKAYISKHPSQCSELPLNCSSRVIPIHGTRVPTTFPPVSTLPFQHVPPSNLTYSVSPPVNQRSFTPALSSGAASPPPRTLCSSVPSRFGATYPSPAPPTDYVVSSPSRQAATGIPHAAQMHDLSDSGYESVGSNLNESPNISSRSGGKISDMQGRYFISGGQISFDPPLDLSSNVVRYAASPQSSQNVSAYNQSNLQMNTIQRVSNGLPQSLDRSSILENTTAKQEWIEAKPVEFPQLYDQAPREWTPPPPDLPSTTDNFPEQWPSTPGNSAYSPDESDLQNSSTQGSNGRPQFFDASERTETQQVWREAKPVEIHQKDDDSGPSQTVRAWVPPSSPEDFDPSTRSSHVGAQTPHEWVMRGVSAAVQTPCGWEGGPTVTEPSTPLSYCASSCPTHHEPSKRKRRRKKVSCDNCKKVINEKTEKEDTLQDSDSKLSSNESLDTGSPHSTLTSQSLKSQENEVNQETLENGNNQKPQEIDDIHEHQEYDVTDEQEEESNVTSNVQTDPHP